jgi:hypothetical protein
MLTRPKISRDPSGWIVLTAHPDTDARASNAPASNLVIDLAGSVVYRITGHFDVVMIAGKR